MTDTPTSAATAEPVAAPKSFPDAMADLVVSDAFKAGQAAMSAALAAYAVSGAAELGMPDLQYAIMSMARLTQRYARPAAA